MFIYLNLEEIAEKINLHFDFTSQWARAQFKHRDDLKIDYRSFKSELFIELFTE